MAQTKPTCPIKRLHLQLAGWTALDWADTFEGISVRHAEDGVTVVSGDLKDQSALFGILRAVESCGMQIVACFVYPGGAA